MVLQEKKRLCEIALKNNQPKEGKTTERRERQKERLTDRWGRRGGRAGEGVDTTQTQLTEGYTDVEWVAAVFTALHLPGKDASRSARQAANEEMDREGETEGDRGRMLMLSATKRTCTGWETPFPSR
jgi:hypothetical protein